MPEPDSPPQLGIADAGAVRNTALQLATQFAGLVFTSALTLFLVRELGPSGYGVYALATGIAGLLVLPAGLGLPMAVGRYIADHRDDLAQIRAILRIGLRLQLPASVFAAAALFATSGSIASAYGEPHLGWPLRWAAVSVLGQTIYNLLVSVPTSVRQSGAGLAMAAAESAVETLSAIALVLAGAGAAGATLGRAAGYLAGAAVGAVLTRRLVGRSVRARAERVRGERVRSEPVGGERVGGERVGGERVGGERARDGLTPRTLIGYAGATFVVDLGVGVIAQIDVILIGAILTSSAVGRFGAVIRLLIVLGYLGVAVAGGVAPRLSRGSGGPDSAALRDGLRFLLLVQGLSIAPMIVWAGPIVTLVFSARYRSAADVLEVLTLYSFASAPAALLSLSITYLGAAQQRVKVVLATLALGVVLAFVLLELVGLLGAAIADDIVALAYLAANLELCHRLVGLDLPSLVRTLARTLLAATVMGLVLWCFGRAQLSAFDWLAGGALAIVAYAATLIVSGELAVTELQAAVEAVSRRFGR